MKEEMVQELIKEWQKGAHGYIPELKEADVVWLGCENVNSLSLFHPTKSKTCNSQTYIKSTKQMGHV
jgi:hypothetical protein